MATRTSVGSGLWSAAGTWDTGVPIAGDNAVIAAGHTVTYDVLFAAAPVLGGSPSIDIYGTLTVDRTAGMAYGLKCGKIYVRSTGLFDCSGDGADAPYPATSSFIYEIQAAADSLTGVSPYSGKLNFVCADPTYKYVALTANAAAGATSLSIDTDLTSDPLWNTGAAAVAIIGVRATGYTTASQETRVCTATATGPNTLTISVGLTAAKAAGSLVAVMDRNIVITGKAGVTPTYGVRNFLSSGAKFNLKARVTGCSYALIQVGNLAVGGCLDGSTYAFSSVWGCDFSGTIANLSGSYPLVGAWACSFKSGFIGFASAVSSGCGVVVENGAVFGPNLNYAFLYVEDCFVDGKVYAMNSNVFYLCGRFILGPNADVSCGYYLASSTMSYGAIMDGASFTTDAGSWDCVHGHGGTFNYTPAGLSSPPFRAYGSYYTGMAMYGPGGSYKHHDYGGVAGAYREDTFGGYIENDAGVVPSGYSESYKTTFVNDGLMNSAPLALRWQRAHELLPGETLRYRMWVRKTSVVTADLPYLCLASRLEDPDFHDPASRGYLDSDTMSDAVDTWEALEVSYTNAGDYPEEVWARLVVPYTSGMNVYFVPERLLTVGRW